MLSASFRSSSFSPLTMISPASITRDRIAKEALDNLPTSAVANSVINPDSNPTNLQPTTSAKPWSLAPQPTQNHMFHSIHPPQIKSQPLGGDDRSVPSAPASRGPEHRCGAPPTTRSVPRRSTRLAAGRAPRHVRCRSTGSQNLRAVGESGLGPNGKSGTS